MRTYRLDNFPVPLYDGLIHNGVADPARGDALLNGVVKVHNGSPLSGFLSLFCRKFIIGKFAQICGNTYTVDSARKDCD